MIVGDLERLLKETPNVKLLYVIPTFQNPSGKTWSLERKTNLAVANRYDVAIVEDAPMRITLFVEFTPQCLAFRKVKMLSGPEVFQNSVSSLRLGWIAADVEVIESWY